MMGLFLIAAYLLYMSIKEGDLTKDVERETYSHRGS